MSKYSSETKTVTRKQLRALGLSFYHAAAITKILKPCRQQGSTYFYFATEVVGSLRQYIQRPKIKPATRDSLKAALNVLLDLIGNVVPAAFGTSTDPELSRLARELMTTISKTDSSLAALKLDLESEVEFCDHPETL